MRDARTGEVGFCGAGNAWELHVFWLNLGKPLQPSPIDSLRIRMHESQSDNQGLGKVSPQRAGSENQSNLSGYLRVERWPWVRAFS